MVSQLCIRALTYIYKTPVIETYFYQSILVKTITNYNKSFVLFEFEILKANHIYDTMTFYSISNFCFDVLFENFHWQYISALNGALQTLNLFVTFKYIQ